MFHSGPAGLANQGRRPSLYNVLEGFVREISGSSGGGGFPIDARCDAAIKRLASDLSVLLASRNSSPSPPSSSSSSSSETMPSQQSIEEGVVSALRSIASAAPPPEARDWGGISNPGGYCGGIAVISCLGNLLYRGDNRAARLLANGRDDEDGGRIEEGSRTSFALESSGSPEESENGDVLLREIFSGMFAGGGALSIPLSYYSKLGILPDSDVARSYINLANRVKGFDFFESGVLGDDEEARIDGRARNFLSFYLTNCKDSDGPLDLLDMFNSQYARCCDGGEGGGGDVAERTAGKCLEKNIFRVKELKLPQCFLTVYVQRFVKDDSNEGDRRDGAVKKSKVKLTIPEAIYFPLSASSSLSGLATSTPPRPPLGCLESRRYELNSFINHLGSDRTGGHWYCHVRRENCDGNSRSAGSEICGKGEGVEESGGHRWYKIDDHQVQLIGEGDKKSFEDDMSVASMYFYKCSRKAAHDFCDDRGRDFVGVPQQQQDDSGCNDEDNGGGNDDGDCCDDVKLTSLRVTASASTATTASEAQSSSLAASSSPVTATKAGGSRGVPTVQPPPPPQSRSARSPHDARSSRPSEALDFRRIAWLSNLTKSNEAYRNFLTDLMMHKINTLPYGLNPNYVVGREVMIKWKDGYYKGTVRHWKGGKWAVMYKDGDVREYKLFKKDFYFV